MGQVYKAYDMYETLLKKNMWHNQVWKHWKKESLGGIIKFQSNANNIYDDFKVESKWLKFKTLMNLGNIGATRKI